MRSKSIVLLLLGGWLVLLGWVVLTYLSPPRLDDYLVTSDEVIPTESLTGAVQGFEIFKLPSLAQYAETVERPLFYPERRPPKPEPEPVALPEPPAPPPEESEITLIGVLITPQSTTAMVRVENAEKTDLLKIGDKVETWQLAEIKTESVVLRKGGETKELTLERNQRKPSMRPHSLQPPAQQPTGQQPNTDTATAENKSPETQDNQAAIDERLRLRQERLKAIAERRRQLLEQQRARSKNTQRKSDAVGNEN
ncbi:MAG: hypothetical protein KDK04_04405 [Candidatus Competibacteraceae bacterium]|nr:hypothetical protein [Candidatus Competibacteraceae bacterium]